MSADGQIARLEARLARERATRLEAERLAEEATRELYVTREQLRLLGTVAVAANETDDLQPALLAAMDAVCAHTGWPAARADVLGAGGLPAQRLVRGELVPGCTRVFELPLRVRSGEVGVRLEFFSPVPTPADTVLLDVVATVGRQLERVLDRVQSEQALRAALGDLERSNAELESFAYAASHDLREPLRTIGGFAQLLSRRHGGRLGPEGDAFLDYIQDGAARLQTLVDDLLTMSRAGRREGRREVVDLDDVAARTVQSLQPAIAESGGTIVVDPLPRVVGDRGQLGQVLANLVGNGLKFHDGGAPQLHVGAVRRDEGWVISVTDDGPGIPPDQAERVFDMFHRVEGGEPTAPGSGLGLAICRRIVEHHGGRIWVEPGPGDRGCRFCVLLRDREPAAATDVPTALPAAPTPPAPRAGAAGAVAA